MSLTVKIGEAKTRLSELLAKVEAGEEIVIARGNEPIARLTRVPKAEDFAGARRRGQSRSRQARQNHARGTARLARGRAQVLMALVVDASLAAAWFLPDEQNDVADQVMAELANNPGRAPSLFWFETRNLFLVAERRGRLRPGEAATTTAQLRGFPIHDEGSGNDRLVLALAERHGLSGYDVSYLALALSQNLPLATLDKELAAAARAQGLEVRGVGATP